MTKVLSIAGTDPSGGAGIQTDLKTILAQGCYGMGVITAVIAQNTTHVKRVDLVSPDMVGLQLDCVLEDIPPDAVKIGMLGTGDIAQTVYQKLKDTPVPSIVIDPVMISSSGKHLQEAGAIWVLQQKLFPMATLITPNIPEAQTLTSMRITSVQDMEQATTTLQQMFGCAVLVKGGHLAGDTTTDIFHDGASLHHFTSQRYNTTSTHGTGCTLSSAIACFLGKGQSVYESVKQAKHYLDTILPHDLKLGHGNGPLHHGYGLKKSY